MILSRFRWQPHGVKSLLPIEFAPEVVLELKLLKILLKCSGLLFACYMYIWNRVQLTSSDFPSLELWRSELHQTRSQLYCSQSSRRKVVKMINLKQKHLCEICALLCPIEGMTQGPEDRPAFYLFTWGREHFLKTIFYFAQFSCQRCLGPSYHRVLLPTELSSRGWGKNLVIICHSSSYYFLPLN